MQKIFRFTSANPKNVSEYQGKKKVMVNTWERKKFTNKVFPVDNTLEKDLIDADIPEMDELMERFKKFIL